MNNYIYILLIIALFALLFVLIKALIPSVRHMLARMPRVVLIILIIAVIIAIILLIRSVASTGGTIGGKEPETEIVEDAPSQFSAENIITISGETILIEGVEATLSEAEKYLTQKAGDLSEVTLVDDYAVASVYHSVLNICTGKGVKYNQANETK